MGWNNVSPDVIAGLKELGLSYEREMKTILIASILNDSLRHENKGWAICSQPLRVTEIFYDIMV